MNKSKIKHNKFKPLIKNNINNINKTPTVQK